MLHSTLMWYWLKDKALIKKTELGCLSPVMRLNLHVWTYTDDWFVLNLFHITGLFLHFLKISENFWIELNWISLFKVSYVIIILHNDSSNLLKLCLINANRPKLIIIILIIQKIRTRILKIMFEQNRSKELYVTTLYLYNWQNICIFRCWDIQINPTWAMIVLHSLQGHASGFHELINFLNSLKEIEHLILFGKNSQILGPKYFRPKKRYSCYQLSDWP